MLTGACRQVNFAVGQLVAFSFRGRNECSELFCSAHADLTALRLITERFGRGTLGPSLKEVTEVPGMGSFTIIKDPAGGMLGLWMPQMAPGS